MAQSPSEFKNRPVSRAGQLTAQSVMLNAALESALSGLDVDLDSELTRYRRLRVLRRESMQTRLTPQSLRAESSRSLHPGSSERATSTVPAENTLLISQVPVAPVAHRGAIAPDTSVEEHPRPTDYLASSEELLKSLADEADATLPPIQEEEEPGILATLFTPLGIGSMLLLLFSSVTLGYLILHPGLLGLNGLPWGSANSSDTEAGSALNRASGEEASMPVSPNLAVEEFPELNLDTLSTLPLQPSGQAPVGTSSLPSYSVSVQPPTTLPSQAPALLSLSSVAAQGLTGAIAPAATPETATQAPETAANPAAPAESAPEPETVASASTTPQPDSYTAPSAPEPAYREPAPAPAAPDTVSAAPADGDYYYVITDYSGDRSLEEARESVGDAYVRNLPDAGAQIQLGAFSNEARAEELLQELQQQGINAEIYHP